MGRNVDRGREDALTFPRPMEAPRPGTGQVGVMQIAKSVEGAQCCTG